MNKFLILVILTINAQLALGQVFTKNIEMSVGSYQGFELHVPVDAKNAEKIWKEYTKPYGTPEWDKKIKEHSMNDVRIASISNDVISIQTRFDQSGSGTKASYLLKSGASFLTEADHTDQFRKTEQFLQQYIYEAERFSTREELKKEENDLTKLKKDLDKLIKKNAGFHKDIEKAKAEIIQKERDVEVNLADQEQNQKEVEAKRENIRNVTLKLSKIGKDNK